MNRLSKVFFGVSFVLFLSLFILPGQAFASEECFPYSLCLEKHGRITKDSESNPFEITVNLLKESEIKAEKSKTPNNTPNKKILPPQSSRPLNPEVLFGLINDYRTKNGLLPFRKEDKVCEVTRERVNEINNEIFVTGRLHAGFYAKNLPYFATENLIYAQTEEKALNWWLNSSIHRAAILGSSKYSCLECSGNSCSEVFTSFDPKKTS